MGDGKGVWVSSDGAATWSADNRGLDTLGVSDVVLDPTAHRLYASESNGGVVMSDDGLRFTSLDSWCLPIAGWGALTLIAGSDSGARWRVATGRGKRVLRHRVDCG